MSRIQWGLVGLVAVLLWAPLIAKERVAVDLISIRRLLVELDTYLPRNQAKLPGVEVQDLALRTPLSKAQKLRNEAGKLMRQAQRLERADSLRQQVKLMIHWIDIQTDTATGGGK